MGRGCLYHRYRGWKREDCLIGLEGKGSFGQARKRLNVDIRLSVDLKKLRFARASRNCECGGLWWRLCAVIRSRHQECGQQYCKSGNSHFHGVCTEHSLSGSHCSGLQAVQS
jgi:hypothetical protein